MESFLEAEGYAHTGRTEEDSIGESFVSALAVIETRCIRENINCIGLNPQGIG